MASADLQVQSETVPSIRGLLASKQVVVCCGTGGVGKTTVSAALALAGARLGRRVLVLTVDPSRRLAEVLGIGGAAKEPSSLPAEVLEQLGIRPPAKLHAWLLDPAQVADDSVRSVIRDDAMAQRFINNPIYRQLSSMAAGMHEYTAMKALHGFVTQGDYELVILDTPPSRHALDFLDAPSRMAAFLEGRVFQLFGGGKPGLVRRAAASLSTYLLRTFAGRQLSDDLLAFLSQFGGIFNRFGGEVAAMRAFLAQPEAAFLLVTTPVREALEEAFFFQEKLQQLGLPFAGFVLNRSGASRESWTLPRREILGSDEAVSDELLTRLQRLAEGELERARHDVGVLERLRSRAGDITPVCDLPLLHDTDGGLASLDDLATLLLQ